MNRDPLLVGILVAPDLREARAVADVALARHTLARVIPSVSCEGFTLTLRRKAAAGRRHRRGGRS